MPTFTVASAINKAELEVVGGKIRNLLGCCEVKYLPVAQIIEHSLPKLFGDEFVFRVAGTTEMGNNHGFAEPDRKELVLREDVYIRLVQGCGRDRMTAIHEMSHLFLHTGNRLFRRMQDEPPPPWMDPEWQAKCLAGVLMMPAALLTGYATTNAVSRDFGVSTDAAQTRLRQIGRRP
jgi:hypothetical protein